MSCENPQVQAWALLQAARSVADDFSASTVGQSISITCQAGGDSLVMHSGHDSNADLTHSHSGGWRYNEQLSPVMQDMLDLYLPSLGTAMRPDVVTGHLGQSVDARIATTEGDAFFVTGEENRRHLHRLRSLSHAVVVGAGTVTADDPQLTTRAVSGANPVRVIIDPQARVAQNLKVMVDGEAPTWLLHADTVMFNELPAADGYRRLAVHSSDGRLEPQDILEVLAKNGLRRIFVEGGGVTVSRFFNAGCLHRLQIATAPLLVGEGVAALQIPGASSMQQALRPEFRLYRMGQDVLWDFQLTDDSPGSAISAAAGRQPLPDLQRLL